MISKQKQLKKLQNITKIARRNSPDADTRNLAQSSQQNESSYSTQMEQTQQKSQHPTLAEILSGSSRPRNVFTPPRSVVVPTFQNHHNISVQETNRMQFNESGLTNTSIYMTDR